MYNVMKAQMYQLKRSNSTYILQILGLLIIALAAVLNIPDTGGIEEMKGSGFMLIIAEVCEILLPMLIMAYTANICGSDLHDKTVNYELMAGRKRISVYSGRSIVAAAVSLVTCLLTAVMPVLVVTALYGWGHTITPQDAMLRMGAMLFVAIRISAFYSCLTFSVKTNTVVYVIGYLLTFMEMIAVVVVNEISDTGVMCYITYFGSLMRIFSPDNYGIGYFEGKDIQVVKDLLGTDGFVYISLAALAAAAVMYLLGYFAAVRRRNMD